MTTRKITTPDWESVIIPYGYHNGEQKKYQELLKKAYAILALDSPPKQA